MRLLTVQQFGSCQRRFACRSRARASSGAAARASGAPTACLARPLLRAAGILPCSRTTARTISTLYSQQSSLNTQTIRTTYPFIEYGWYAKRLMIILVLHPSTILETTISLTQIKLSFFCFRFLIKQMLLYLYKFWF